MIDHFAFFWARGKPVGWLRDVARAAGMPDPHRTPKADVLAWLMEHADERLSELMDAEGRALGQALADLTSRR